MKFAYEPFILRKLADERIYLVNPKMPFEYFVDMFFVERPFFLVSVLDDARVAITPNPMVVPLNLFQTGYWPTDLFPNEWEYVTIKNGTYPLILTAHPIAKFEEWLKKFEKTVLFFTKETLADFVNTPKEFIPLEIEKPFKPAPVKV